MKRLIYVDPPPPTVHRAAAPDGRRNETGTKRFRLVPLLTAKREGDIEGEEDGYGTVGYGSATDDEFSRRERRAMIHCSRRTA